MAKNNDVIDLKKQLNSNKLSNLYVFYGEETYLIDLYIKKISSLIPDMGFPEMNNVEFDGEEDSIDEISDTLDSFPVMAPKRLITIKNSGAFSVIKKDKKLTDFYALAISQLTDDTVLIFRETKVDKRSSIYKAAKKAGTVVEFLPLSYSDLVSFCNRSVRDRGKTITRAAVEYLLSVCDTGLYDLTNEIDKLSSYSQNEITKDAIDKIASKSLQTKIFDLCDSMMNKDADSAVKIIENLKQTKEYPLAIMYLLYTTFDKMFKAKLMQGENTPRDIIVKSLGIPPFAANKYFSGAAGFTTDELSRLLCNVPLYDLEIKLGQMTDWQALWKLVVDAVH